jgi:predicted CxxxxCH...CXXCH cytochrome family protein
MERTALRTLLLTLLAACSGGGGGTSCTSCHATSALASGAHPAHLVDGPIRSAIGCSECHVVPTSADHAAAPVTVTFATAPGDLAAAGGVAPEWSRAEGRCSGVYCHGASLDGGAATSPAWTTVDGSQVHCGGCHGYPPAANGHLQVEPAFCAGCHPQTVKADGVTILASAGKHVNGTVEASPFAHTPFNHAAAALADRDACKPCHGPSLDQLGCNTCHVVQP